MNRLEGVLTRALARQSRRALATRRTSVLAADPFTTIGIATIKIVTEEQVQALAFGRMPGKPEIVTRLDPLSRDVQDLLPFARFMTTVAREAIADGGNLRVWVPHAATLETLDVLGHRYWRNDTAPPEIKRMGEVCRIIAHEATFPGQQLLANAAELLRTHVTTGLSPIEEMHLGALLAWLDPNCAEPLVESRERIRIPASGVLANTPDRPDDDRVERLRKAWKGATGRTKAALAREMTSILGGAARREWRLVEAGRAAFLRLGLAPSGLAGLVRLSTERVHAGLTRGHFPARQAHRVGLQYDQMQAGQAELEYVSLEHDDKVREQARRSGLAIDGAIALVDQPKPGFHPCSIEVDTAQQMLRCRRDDKVKVIGTNVTGIVRGISAVGTGTRVRIEIENGVRTSNVLRRGARVEIVERAYAHARIKTFAQVKDRAPWVFFAEEAPVLAARRPTSRSALATARGMKRS